MRLHLGPRAKKHLPLAVYSLLSLGILGPLLLPGYILTLDMVFAPDVDIADRLYGLDEWRVAASTPLWVAIQAASKVVPTWLCQKVLLFLLFFLAGLGAHRLMPLKGAGRYFAGLLYMVNPFTYVRFLAGQWGVLGAYALMPFAIKAFLELLEKRGPRQAAKVAILSTLVGMFQLHGFVLLFMAFLIILAVRVVKDRNDRAAVFSLSKSVATAAILFLPLNLYWLLPALTARETIVEQIGQADLLLFAPKATSDLGAMFDLAALYGFWRVGYTYAKDLLPLWWLGFAFIFYLATVGFVYKVRDRTIGWLVRAFALIWLVALVFAAGAAIEFTRPPFEWLFDHLFFFRGFRDSQKFVALLCLCYSYLGGLGVSQLARSARYFELKKTKSYRFGLVAVVVLALIAPLVYSYPIFGFRGQLQPTDYPQDWFEVNDQLNADEDDFNVLFLPWHMYMDYGWLPNRDKRLENPAHHFFDKPAICGDNIEAGGIYSQSTNPVSNYVESLLGKADHVDNLGELLSPLNVKYVVLFHEVDYESYGFLFQQQDLAVELETESLTLFKNQHPTARAYAVDSVVHVDSLDEYVQLSQVQDVMDHLYVFSAGHDDIVGTTGQPLDCIQTSPVNCVVEGSQSRWTIFTVPQRVTNQHWQYNGEATMTNLGLMPAFQSDTAGGTVTYSRFYSGYLPGYIISILAFVALIAGCLLAARRKVRDADVR